MTPAATVDRWSRTFPTMQNEWRALAADSPIDSWERTRASMSEEVAALQAAGRWRSGERSLLAALGLADDERKLCTALRWLLQPHGHHGLGYALLRLLWERLDVQPENEHPVTATREERRAGRSPTSSYGLRARSS